MNTKLRITALVFFSLVALYLILGETIREKIKKTESKSTPEKTFCRAQIAKIDSVIDVYNNLLIDTNSIRIEAFIQQEEIEKIIPCKENFPTGIQTVDMGFVKKAYPNDSTVVIYSIDLEQLMVYHLFDHKIINTDYVTDSACYLAGKQVLLHEFQRHYPYPFGK